MNLEQTKVFNTVFCVIAFMLIGASILTSINCPTCPPFSTFMNSLDDKQRATHKAIVDQRRSLYFQGLLLGVVVALITVAVIMSTNDVSDKLPLTGCAFAGVVVLTQFIYYYMSPKLPLMKNSLTTPEQLQLWSQVNDAMKRRYYGGAVLGLLGYAAVPYIVSLMK